MRMGEPLSTSCGVLLPEIQGLNVFSMIWSIFRQNFPPPTRDGRGSPVEEERGGCCVFIVGRITEAGKLKQLASVNIH